jgi:hypothetical protein
MARAVDGENIFASALSRNKAHRGRLQRFDHGLRHHRLHWLSSTGSIKVDFSNMPRGVSASAESGGLFRKKRVKPT